MDCILNRPTCKRTIMTSKGPFRKETCPMSQKAKCMLKPEQCPLLPEDKRCTINKVMDIIKQGGCFAGQQSSARPACCCCCAEPEPEPENTVAKCLEDRIVQLPPCARCRKGFDPPMKDGEKGVAPSTSQSAKKKKKTLKKKKSDRKLQIMNKTVPDCTLSSRRPFPCADCLLELLDCPISSVDYDNSKVYCKARATKCPFTQIIDICDIKCLCSNVPAIETGPQCPFLPEPCPCQNIPTCPLSRFPPNPLVERIIPPVCQKPRCRCYCPVIPNPCSITYPECPVHSGKVKCPLKMGKICPTMLPQICCCLTSDDGNKRYEKPAKKINQNEATKETEKRANMRTSISKSKRVSIPKLPSKTLEVIHEMDVEKKSEMKLKVRESPLRLPSPPKQTMKQPWKDKDRVSFSVNVVSVPFPDQEQYQKTCHDKRLLDDQFTKSRSDQFSYFVDTRRSLQYPDTGCEAISENVSTVGAAGAYEGIEDYYNGSDHGLYLTSSDLYSTQLSTEDNRAAPGVCHCWSQAMCNRKRKRFTNYPSIRTESLYKASKSEKDLTHGQSCCSRQGIANKGELAKTLPPPSIDPGCTHSGKKIDASKLCRAPLGNDCNCIKRFQNPPNPAVAYQSPEMTKQMTEDFVNRISTKIQSPEFRFFQEFDVDICESDAPQELNVLPKECPCEGMNVHSCECGNDCQVPPSGCPCGESCPSKLSPPAVERTFHVPNCPQTRPLPQPKSPEKGEKVCPFAPNECPLGPYCPFPVTSRFDPTAPKILKSDAVCFCNDQSCMKLTQQAGPSCPLEKVNHNKCVCRCNCQVGGCLPCRVKCPLAQPESLPPVFKECPFATCQCPPNVTPPPIVRLCKCCARTAEPDLTKNDACEPKRTWCQKVTANRNALNPMPTAAQSTYNANVDNTFKFGQNAQPEHPGNFGNPQKNAYYYKNVDNYKVPEVASLPASLTKLLDAGNAEIIGLIGVTPPCCAGCRKFTKTNYESNKPKKRTCCPCADANKSKLECPLGLEDCPCLNLTQTDTCPLNAVQCPMERPFCPIKPAFKPELKLNESPNVQTIFISGSETNLSKKSVKIEQAGEKILPTSVSVKPTQLSKLQLTNQIAGSATDLSKSVKHVTSQMTTSAIDLNKPVKFVPSQIETSITDFNKPVKTVRNQMAASALVFNKPIKHVTNQMETSAINFNKTIKHVTTQVGAERVAQFRRAGADMTNLVAANQISSNRFPNTHVSTNQLAGSQLAQPTPKCLLQTPQCPMKGVKPAVIANCGDTIPNADCKVENGLECPIKQQPCELFPEGRCPMMELGACNCNYPVAPCMLPAQCGYVMAPPQYCYKEDCCMGLTLPPTYPAGHGKYDTGFYYKFRDWKPGEKSTKHYIEISEIPPPMNFFQGHEAREHDNWWILREGKGYEECKKIKEIIEKRGPVGHRGTQFNKKDNPIDIETQTIMENRMNREEHKQDLVHPVWKE